MKLALVIVGYAMVGIAFPFIPIVCYWHYRWMVTIGVPGDIAFVSAFLVAVVAVPSVMVSVAMLPDILRWASGSPCDRERAAVNTEVRTHLDAFSHY